MEIITNTMSDNDFKKQALKVIADLTEIISQLTNKLSIEVDEQEITKKVTDQIIRDLKEEMSNKNGVKRRAY